MIQLGNDKNTITIKFNDDIIMRADKETDEVFYEVKLPLILCSSQKDAEAIQQKLDTCVAEICRKRIQ